MSTTFEETGLRDDLSDDIAIADTEADATLAEQALDEQSAGLPAPVPDPAADAPADATDEIVHLAIASIDPDPDNPRKTVDDELAPSIKQSGVLEPITVRPHPDPERVAAGVEWMIVHGHRRHRGSVVAGRSTIPAKITLEAEDEGERLILQTVSNTGKALTPMEEAWAWKRAMDVNGWTVAQIVAITGKPKSTVGDRLAMVTAPEPFVKLFERGVLSPAAAPIVRQFADLPVDIIEKGIARASDWYQFREALKTGTPMDLGEVKRALESGIMQQMGRVQDAPGYEGPTVVFRDIAYATDLPEWKKHFSAEQARQNTAQKREREAANKPEPKASKKASKFPKIPEGTKAITTGNWDLRVAGVALLVGDDGKWALDRVPDNHLWDPADFPAGIADNDLVRIMGPNGQEGIGTTYVETVREAKRKFKPWLEEQAKLVVTTAAKQLLEALPKYEVSGKGLFALVAALSDTHYNGSFANDIKAVATLLELPDDDSTVKHLSALGGGGSLARLSRTVPKLGVERKKAAQILAAYATGCVLDILDFDQLFRKAVQARVTSIRAKPTPWGRPKGKGE
jgi:ParB/RepB/Spo0J family partition protein